MNPPFRVALGPIPVFTSESYFDIPPTCSIYTIEISKDLFEKMLEERDRLLMKHGPGRVAILLNVSHIWRTNLMSHGLRQAINDNIGSKIFSVEK